MNKNAKKRYLNKQAKCNYLIHLSFMRACSNELIIAALLNQDPRWIASTIDQPLLLDGITTISIIWVFNRPCFPRPLFKLPFVRTVSRSLQFDHPDSTIQQANLNINSWSTLIRLDGTSGGLSASDAEIESSARADLLHSNSCRWPEIVFLVTESISATASDRHCFELKLSPTEFASFWCSIQFESSTSFCSSRLTRTSWRPVTGCGLTCEFLGRATEMLMKPCNRPSFCIASRNICRAWALSSPNNDTPFTWTSWSFTRSRPSCNTE